MSDCIFCKIVAGQIPAAKVYEDATKLAFMDIGPIQPGHVLLITKKHYVLLTDVPDEEAADLGRCLPRLGRAVVAAAKADGFNVHQTNGRCSGQAVFHVHFHVIPRKDDDGYSFRWMAGSYRPGEVEQWRQKIDEQLKNA